MAGNFNILEIFMIFMLVYVIFSFWIHVERKLLFTISANPENPNLNLDCTDYADSCL